MKLSIITINFNNADGLLKTIENINQQNFTDYEYIIIDGGSTDKSVAVLKDNSDKISYWISEKDKGVYHAMNKGIAQSKGEYLLMLNSGDVLANAHTLYDVFELQACSEDILYGNVTWLKENQFFRESVFPDVLTFQFFWYKSLGHQAAFIRRSVHNKVGLYDEVFRICSDWKLLILAICKYDLTYKHVNTTIALCDCTGLSWNSENFALMNTEKKQVLQEQFPLFYNDYKELEVYKNNTFQNKFDNLKNNIKNTIKRTLGHRKVVLK